MQTSPISSGTVIESLASLVANEWQTSNTPVLSAAVDNIDGYDSTLAELPVTQWPVAQGNSTFILVDPNAQTASGAAGQPPARGWRASSKSEPRHRLASRLRVAAVRLRGGRWRRAPHPASKNALRDRFANRRGPLAITAPARSTASDALTQIELEALAGGFAGEPLDDEASEYVFVVRSPGRP